MFAQQSIDPATLVAIVFGNLVLIAIVTAVAATYVRVVATRTQAALKQLMLERGMSAEDIVRVLQSERPPASEVTPTPIGALMAENGYEAEDIGKVVRVWDRLPPGVQATLRAMVEQGYQGADLAQVLDACPTRTPASPEEEWEAPRRETTDIKV
jgi:hypothetical protein